MVLAALGGPAGLDAGGAVHEVHTAQGLVAVLAAGAAAFVVVDVDVALGEGVVVDDGVVEDGDGDG